MLTNVLLLIMLVLISSNTFAADSYPILSMRYSMHIIQLCNAIILLTILLRKSIGHQNRLNWFFGAIATVVIFSSIQVFQRFFGIPGSVLHYGFNMIVLLVYFVVYWLMTWPIKQRQG
jgi:hypothetical protein